MTRNVTITGSVNHRHSCPQLAAPGTNSSPRLRWASALTALLVLGSSASATPFFFSTGQPDGKMATLSKPASGGQIQTETADDFILTESSVLYQATFTGLMPSGASLHSIKQVEVELYHVFSKDSVNPPSGKVPTRVNSPADVEISEATRDSANGSLHYWATLVNPNFSAANSVLHGIHAMPDQTTHGEGPVTGQEVTITVSFNPPIALPADHYFFRPEVLLSSGDFLWLSAPKPIVAPGTPINPDLQSWTRNDHLAPDWLRIGTDIVGQGAFNASFSLYGETDQDGDGVGDSLDYCPDTAAGEVVDGHGCSLDQLVPCSGPAAGGAWRNHGSYVYSYAHAVIQFLRDGRITEEQAENLIRAAAQSSCGAHRR